MTSESVGGAERLECKLYLIEGLATPFVMLDLRTAFRFGVARGRGSQRVYETV